MAQPGFMYKTRVSFYDTDAMGVMHHAAFMQKFEDARVAWLRDSGLDCYHYPKADLVLAVTEAKCNYRAPCFFDQEISIYLQVKRTRLKLFIQYAMFDESNSILATGSTTHVPMDAKLKLTKYPAEFKSRLEKKLWTETWPSNL